jgi:hypothetical protein
VTAVIVAIVRFPLDPPLPADEVRDMFEASAPSYQKLPGLLRKHYLRAEDGATAGGVYLFTQAQGGADRRERREDRPEESLPIMRSFDIR